MRKFLCSVLALLLLTALLPAAAASEAGLVPVGRTVGLELALDGVYVVKFDAADALAPARVAGIRLGDRIVCVNGTKVSRSSELRDQIEAGHGSDLILRVRRGGKDMSFTVRPVYTQRAWRIGVYVQDRIAGLGTVTYFDPETGAFGALGHGVAGSEAGNPPVCAGVATQTEVVSVRKGAAGAPGELRGSAGQGGILGTIEQNTDRGLFGHGALGGGAPCVPVAERAEVHTGQAELLCNVSGTEVGRYAIEIETLSFGAEPCKNLRLRVTDPALLSATGGIVQGMSGSPILQDGKLIGAVTHVLVQDPTRGYGIFIENMLAAERDAA